MQVAPADVATSGLPNDVVTLLMAMLRLSEARDRSGPLPYQTELLEFGYFTLTNAMRSGASYVIDDKSVLYCLNGNDRFTVIATYIAVGSALFGLVDLQAGICYNLGDANWGVRSDHLQKFAAILATSESTSAGESIPAKHIVTGDANFAHVLWNQLPALENALAQNDGKARVVTTHEPLGPLNELVAGLTSESIVRGLDYELARTQNVGARIFVPVGGALIPYALRTRLARLFLSNAGVDAQNILNAVSAAPVLILTLRSHNRTATNLVDTLTTICHAGLERHPGLHIILDGHSYPADFKTNRSYDVAAQSKIVDEQSAMAREIHGRVTTANQPRIHVAVGFDIRDSIAIGSTGTFYFAHHGTVQHKIGWFYDCPGIVHSNPETLARDPAPWVQSQVERGVRPTYLPRDFVSEAETAAPDDSSPLATVLATLHHENYRFNDPIQTASYVLAVLANELLSLR